MQEENTKIKNICLSTLLRCISDTLSYIPGISYTYSKNLVLASLDICNEIDKEYRELKYINEEMLIKKLEKKIKNYNK